MSERLSLSPYRRRIPAKDARVKLISAAEGVMTTGNLPVTLATPPFEAVIHEADVPRSTAYRLFPDRHQFERVVLRTLIEGDPYRSEELRRTGHRVIETSLHKRDRSETIGRVGQVCITVPNHLCAVRIEAAVASLAATSGPDEEIEANLSAVRTDHLQTVGDLLGVMHATWGEAVLTTPEDNAYGVAFASLARTFALQPLGPIDDDTRYAVFSTLADRYAAE